jgi:hypothetical protein
MNRCVRIGRNLRHRNRAGRGATREATRTDYGMETHKYEKMVLEMTKRKFEGIGDDRRSGGEVVKLRLRQRDRYNGSSEERLRQRDIQRQ